MDEATDDQSLPKPKRKPLQTETPAKKSCDAKLLKLADKTSNLRSVALSPPSHWDDQRRREYVAWSGDYGWLDGEFEKAEALAFESISDKAV